MNEAYIDVQQVLGYEFEATAFNYTDREIILYALGVGAGKNPLDLQELAFVYEGSAQGFRALPTFAVLFPGSMFQQLLKVPGIKFNLMKLLHGEQYLEILKPLPTSAQITSWGKISQVYDKGSGALIAIDVNSQDASGDLVAFNRITLFIRGIGGFGGERGPSTRDLNEAPEREPDAVWQESIPENQALLYRLSGDRNPLHADPDMAAVGGFKRPILHGLCTYGFAARAVLEQFAGNDPGRFASISARFARHFFPGETLVTEMWDAGGGAILFRSKALERDELVLTNAKVQLK
jgi:3-hydroxyacyl-CoA dehydrogenase/3a,7a,12a-trihydroxy-5b-cholest-24-enoyl-CoA hydratase